MLHLLERSSAGHEENPLRVGAYIDVWWPRDNQSFQAKIIEISGSSIELLYDDGEQKVYLPSEILPRIAIGQVFSTHLAQLFTVYA